MFGYVNVNRKELSAEDEKLYQSFYCGLCRQLKADGGAKCQLLLNYDMTFLAVLLCGLYEGETETRDFRCMIHPAKKHTAVLSEFTAYASAMDVALSYHSFLDAYNDEKNMVKAAYAKNIKKTYDEISQLYPDKVEAIEEYVSKLAEAEKAGETDLDKVCGLTGEMMAKLFVYYQDDIWTKDLADVGFYLGKFIYLLDAYEDLKKDMCKGNYNPLIKLYNEDRAGFEDYVNLSLTSYMAECAKAFERLPIIEYADILRNILYSGVWTKYEYLRLKKNDRKQEGK